MVPRLLGFTRVRRLMFRTVSQTAVNYRDSPLSEGTAGAVRGGDRLPWVTMDAHAGDDNYTPLTSLDWQVHVYGAVTGELEAWCRQRGLPLHVWPWREPFGGAGLRRDATYLIRPDGYVALADATGHASALASYLDSRRLKSLE